MVLFPYFFIIGTLARRDICFCSGGHSNCKYLSFISYVISAHKATGNFIWSLISDLIILISFENILFVSLQLTKKTINFAKHLHQAQRVLIDGL